MGTSNRKETTAIENAPPRPAARWGAHGAVLVGAVLLRLYFIANMTWYARSDTRDFHEYALNLLRGEGFVCYWNEAPVRDGLTNRQVHSVGYPLFLAGVYALTGFDTNEYAHSYMANLRVGAHALPAQGFNPKHVMLAHVLLDVITMFSLVAMAYRYFDFAVALLVQILFGLYVSWTPNLITETLFFTLFTSGAALLAWNPDFRRRGHSLAFSLVGMMAVMTKPIGVVLYVWPAFWVLRRLSWERIRRAAPLAVPLAIFIGIMFWRSYHYYGHCFLSSTGAQHRACHNLGFDYIREHERLREQLGRVPNEWEIMDYFNKLRRDAYRKDPMLAVRIYFLNLIQMFQWKADWQMEWIWNANFHDRPDVAARHQALFKLSLLWYPLGVLGVIFFGRRAPVPAVLIVVFLALHAVVSHGSHRYMAPVNVMFTLFSSAVLVAAGRWLWREALNPAGDSPPATGSSRASSTAR